MYLIQKATRIVNQWTLNQEDASEVLSSFISSESALLDRYADSPSIELENSILDKLSSYACDYLFTNTLSYL